MDKIKYVKLEQPDGSYSDNIPLAVDADHVDVNGNTLTNVLGNKADNADIDNLQSQINSLASGSPLVASSVSEMTDTTRVYVNTTNGHWYYYNGTEWTDGGVYQASEDSDTLTNLKNSISEKLLLNNSIMISGSLDNQSTGSCTSDNNYNYNYLYNLINYYVGLHLVLPILANEEYYLYLESTGKDCEQIVLYCSNDERFSGKTYTIKLKKNKPNLFKINTNDFLQYIDSNNNIHLILRDIEIGTNQIKLFIVKNKDYFNMPYINLNSLKSYEWLEKENIENYPFIEKSKNYFNKETITDGIFIDPASGNIAQNENYISSDFIPVDKAYIIANQNWRFITQYNGQYGVISKIPSDIQNRSSLLLDENTKFVRLSLDKRTMNVNLYMIEQNETETSSSDYVPYGYFINEKFLQLKNKFENSPLYGKKVAWVGSSITEGYRWCELVNNAFNFNAKNCGVGGTTMCYENEKSMCTLSRLQGNFDGGSNKAIPTDTEIIFIECGTNDWARNFQLGNKQLTFNNTNTEIELDLSKFKSACHQFFKNATSLFPNAKIIAVGTPFGKLPNRDMFTNKYGILNNENLQSTEYGDALKEIANMWGCYAFNFGNLMQINDNNISTLIPDGLHLTTEEAYTRAGNVVINELLKIEK